MYEDLRAFIAQVEALGALRRIDGADPVFELGGITEVAAGLPECPALLFDSIKGFARGFRVFTNATVSPQRAALALGIDPRLAPIDALKEWRRRRADLKMHFPRQGESRAGPRELYPGRRCRPLPRARVAQGGRRPLHRLGKHRRHARSGQRLGQCVDLSGPGAFARSRDGAVRPCRPAWRPHRTQVLGARQALPGRRGERAGSLALHRRVRVPARGRLGIRLRRRDPRPSGRGARGPAHRSAGPGALRRSCSKARLLKETKRCRKARSANSPATTPPTSVPAPGDAGARRCTGATTRSCSARRR